MSLEPQRAESQPAEPRRKTVLLTGAGRLVGIGAGIARQLAADGWDLALAYWPDYDSRMPWGTQPDDVERLTAELEAIGAKVISVPADFQDPEAVDGLMADVAAPSRARQRTTAVSPLECLAASGHPTRPCHRNAGSPVMCWPRISVWTSSVPS